MAEPVVTFLPYQKRWLQDASRFKIGMFTRRGGKTFGACGEIADDCFQAEIAGRKTRWTILSRSEATAKEAMEDALKPIVRGFFAAYNRLATILPPEFEEGEFYAPELDATYKTHEVRFPGGSRITALSASPDAARGFGGNLLLDEFAFHRDSRRIWGSAFPVAARGGHKIRVISTPNGKGNKFFELMTAEDNGWSRHHVDIYEAVAQGLEVDIDELRAGMADEDAWAQEFELQWLDAASSWLDYDLIASCEEMLAGDPARYTGKHVYVGVDIAARNDLFVIWVLEDLGERLVTREVIAEKRISFAEQDALLASVFDRFNVIRVAIDQTGMGEKPVEDATRRYGSSRVDGVLFTASRKLELATVLKERMQDRRLAIPGGDPVLRADLHAIRSRVGPTGIRRLVAEGDTDGHADRFWALALAAGAAEAAPVEYAYRPVVRSAHQVTEGPDEDEADRGWWRPPLGAGLRGGI
ncbi:terminase [Salipiger thiooxidans]|uniref:terminase large subunit domain-containing protein n=1 Tax=Salipiger thiooxidans TaxID=282683 RepID=UPI001A909882|nr:terminase family protein [Salipiger thiooxidans]MBN8190351.1 terminase [Salipiger thiooxidans]